MRSWLLNAQRKWTNARFFRRDVGMFLTQRGTPVKIGTNGESDVVGYIPYGNGHVLFCSIEFKTGKSRQSKDQVRYQAMVEKLGGMYVVIRADDEFDAIENSLEHKAQLKVS